jgi:hypothetical protein
VFWIAFAAVIWLFIFLFLRSDLIKYWSAGFWSVLAGYFLNDFFIKNGFYFFNNTLYPIRGTPAAFFILLAGIGIVIIFFLPQDKIWQLPYLIFLSAIFSGLELFTEKQGFLTYLQWTPYYSFLFKLFFLIALAWLSSLTIKPRKNSYYFDRNAF